MSKYTPLFSLITFKHLQITPLATVNLPLKSSVVSTEVPKKFTLKNVGKIYKQFVFFVFAFASIWEVKYKTLKFKSLILSYWQKLSAYTVII